MGRGGGGVIFHRRDGCLPGFLFYPAMRVIVAFFEIIISIKFKFIAETAVGQISIVLASTHVVLTMIEHGILQRMTYAWVVYSYINCIVLLSIFPTLELRNKYMSEFQRDSPLFGVSLNIFSH